VLASGGDWGVHVRYVDNLASIGNADVIAMGVIHAVDVFKMQGAQSSTSLGRPTEVCLQGSGRLVFLDAATSPRALSAVPATPRDGYLCATLHTAGTLVLVEQ